VILTGYNSGMYFALQENKKYEKPRGRFRIPIMIALDQKKSPKIELKRNVE